MGTLTGKVAVITGSSRGLGLGIAQAFAREGAAVILSGRSEASLQQAIEQLRQQGARADGLPTDVAELSQVKALADFAVHTFGKIDIWVNNAGTSGVYGPTVSIDPERYERVLRTNIFGTYYGSLVALQHFLAQGTGGKLINILGRGDTQPVPYQNAYAPSKTWVRSFTLALAKEKEYANASIGIFAMNPGLVDTDLLRSVDVVQGYEKKVQPLSTIIRLWANPPAVPAEKAVWLASSATDGKTGLQVNVLGRRQLLTGALRDLRRRLTRRPAPDTSLHITSKEPYLLLPEYKVNVSRALLENS